MPNFQTHEKFGYFMSILVAFLFFGYFQMRYPTGLTGWKLLLIPFFIYIYSNLPDLDHHMGRLRKQIFMILFFVLAMVYIVYIVYGLTATLMIVSCIGAFMLFIYKQTHRKLMHTYGFIMLASLPLIYFHWYIAVTACVAGCSHIFIDRLNSRVKRMFPKKKEKQMTLI